MPSITVKIDWDTPDDPNWLNLYSIELVLAEYCPNTAFEVSELKTPNGADKFESDTLTEAYFDRNQAAMLAASLAEQIGDGLCAGWKENPDDPDWPILYINLPQGQISWHIPKTEQVDFGTAPWYAEWDGHDLAEKRKRIDDYLKDW